MADKVKFGEDWYILASTATSYDRRRVLKHNDTFAMFNRFGDIQSLGFWAKKASIRATHVFSRSSSS